MTRNALLNSGLRYVGEIYDLTFADMLEIKQLGAIGIGQIYQYLIECDMHEWHIDQRRALDKHPVHQMSATIK